MFERFTKRARLVIVQAQNEAERLQHDHVGTEHLLLGLLREEDGVAAQTLVASGVTLGGVRDRVEGIVGYGEGGSGQAPFRRRAKTALEHSLEEALGLGHDYIGTEHLLLGLLSGDDRLTRRIFDNLNVDANELRQEVMTRVGGTGKSRGASGPPETTRGVLRRSSLRRSDEGEGPDYRRFTKRARRIVVLAQDESRRFGHNYIGTGHLLLGMLRDKKGIGALSLGVLGVRLEEAREQVESIAGRGEEGAGDQAPFTPRSKKVIRMAATEAARLDDYRVDDGHVLLGLVGEGKGGAARVLSNLGIDPGAVRREVVGRLPDRPAETDPAGDVERGAGNEEENGRLFRASVSGIRTDLSLPRPLPVAVDVSYSYISHGGSAGADPGDIAESIREELLEPQAGRPEVFITTIGERLLGAFPAMLEVTVTVSGVPEPSDAPTFSMTATFPP